MNLDRAGGALRRARRLGDVTQDDLELPKPSEASTGDARLSARHLPNAWSKGDRCTAKPLLARAVL